MSSASTKQALRCDSVADDRNDSRSPSYGNTPTVLADIYQERINIAIWERSLDERLRDAVNDFLASNDQFETVMTVAPENALARISEATGRTVPDELAYDIAELVDMFCCLFELNRAGLRLATLSRAMCPRFHVDHVPCRLLTTYHGVATEWLPHQAVDRSLLGSGSNGQSDADSGLYEHHEDIEQLTCGDVALLKGERWDGNENAGLVHRSPALGAAETRLLFSLDFSD